MKIKFLGTAAAEGWPALFCECENCRRAREKRGKNIRTRSSCLIDEKYMVDFPPDTYWHELNEDFELSRVEHIIVTHSHDDHFYPEDIMMRKEPYAHINRDQPLYVYGSDSVKAKFMRVNVEEDKKNRIVFKEVEAFHTFCAGEAKVTPLLADHIPDEKCFLYLIDIGGKVLLYGHDTGIFPEKTWEFLKGRRIDAAILDCTDGPGPCMRYHMGFPACLKVKDRLLKERCIGGGTVLIISHFSHNGGFLHDELKAMSLPHGFITAYDGMEIQI
ncbi:MBL fold metallo-hydrolase [Caproicibacter fermentans]|uniref:Metallo-beta-lactamase domain-containing protein n=1 Tax=Caproicibacter fermentans TaxID=2576756 RepID=A0A7G8T641_9FIRM|nr:MBL fold metallo-hydrolase [Caproicibacter fermentans]QNK39082.1 hypothetical protein HCR03_09760 [Caproicibacter fermentans]